MELGWMLHRARERETRSENGNSSDDSESDSLPSLEELELSLIHI